MVFDPTTSTFPSMVSQYLDRSTLSFDERTYLVMATARMDFDVVLILFVLLTIDNILSTRAVHFVGLLFGQIEKS